MDLVHVSISISQPHKRRRPTCSSLACSRFGAIMHKFDCYALSTVICDYRPDFVHINLSILFNYLSLLRNHQATIMVNPVRAAIQFNMLNPQAAISLHSGLRTKKYKTLRPD